MRALVRLFAGLVGLVFVYLTAAMVGALVPGAVTEVPKGDDTQIVLIAGPIHYDILLPLDAQTRQAFDFVAGDGVPLQGADWLVVGWGSHAFYTTTGDYTDLDAQIIWDAATGDSAVLRFNAAYGDWSGFGIPVRLSDDQYRRLRGEVLMTLSRSPEGAPQVVSGAALTGTDVFYEAGGHFSIIQTCNVWIGQMLRRIGVPMGLWTPTPYAVKLSRWWFD